MNGNDKYQIKDSDYIQGMKEIRSEREILGASFVFVMSNFLFCFLKILNQNGKMLRFDSLVADLYGFIELLGYSAFTKKICYRSERVTKVENPWEGGCNGIHSILGILALESRA